MPTIAVRGVAVRPVSATVARIAVVTKPRPPAPRIVPAAGTAVMVRPAVVAMQTARPSAVRGPFAVRTWRILGPHKAEPVGELHGLGQVGPTPAQLSMMLDGGNAILDMAIDASRPLLAWGFAGAIEAYKRGQPPADLWGRDLARALAYRLLVVGGLINLRQALAVGSWSWLIEGDTLTAWGTEAMQRASSGLGWISNSYITGDPDPRIAPTWLDRLGWATGVCGLSAAIAGAPAVVEAAVSAGLASADDAGRLITAEIPAAIRGALSVAEPAATVAATKAMSTNWKTLIEFSARTQLVKWTAVAVSVGVAMPRVPDAINAFRGGQTRVSEAAADAAGALVQDGIKHNDPEKITAGLEAMKVFQKGAGESDKYLWAAGGLLAGKLLDR